ncbi:MAG: nucleotidyl transferase AbiEii/AbiGii toxin family protein [Pirellulales bacterium]|nr:nucleotidyl transferase AbiEii/AbiGii toxin family protein [Pirellulales bacterium]
MPPTFKPKLEILPPAQLRLWDELGNVPSQFTLYGGTAIALHLGHRQSADFDFFGSADFDPDVLLQTTPFLKDATVTQKSPDTLTAIVDRGDPVQVSFFGLPGFTRINKPHPVDTNNLNVASILDLAGAKAAVVQKRAEAKDYIDIDAMIQSKAVSLSQALAAGKVIYGSQFNPQVTLKALCYFEDGTVNTLPANTRERLVEAVRSVDLANLPTLEKSPHKTVDRERDRGMER